jgi:tRNA A37 threonylcarbamoyltransferase TsaD
MEEIKIKLQYYINLRPEINFLTIGGGVSANRLLRKSITSLPVKVILPRLKYTNDNAAMIAAYAHLLIKQMDVIRRNKI